MLNPNYLRRPACRRWAERGCYTGWRRADVRRRDARNPRGRQLRYVACPHLPLLQSDGSAATPRGMFPLVNVHTADTCQLTNGQANARVGRSYTPPLRRRRPVARRSAPEHRELEQNPFIRTRRRRVDSRRGLNLARSDRTAASGIMETSEVRTCCLPHSRRHADALHPFNTLRPAPRTASSP